MGICLSRVKGFQVNGWRALWGNPGVSSHPMVGYFGRILYSSLLRFPFQGMLGLWTDSDLGTKWEVRNLLVLQIKRTVGTPGGARLPHLLRRPAEWRLGTRGKGGPELVHGGCRGAGPLRRQGTLWRSNPVKLGCITDRKPEGPEIWT